MLVDGIDWNVLAEIRQPPVPLWALEASFKAFLAAWLFYFGACVGSFLNVVVYRLPRGLNLVHPGSRCPTCGHAIRARDNLPIFGWLVLGGRCRDCGEPIAARYYFVELTVGLLFLVIGVFEAFLPRGVMPPLEAGRQWLAMHDGAPFWSMYAVHVGLAATLVTATLIEYDGSRVPRRLFAPILLVGLALPMVWPSIRPLPLAPQLFWPDWLAGLGDGLAGVAAGAAFGLLVGLGWWLGSGRRVWLKGAPVTLLAAAGCVLGWQRIVEVAPLAVLVYVIGVVATRASKTIFPLAAPLLALALPLLLPLGLHYFQAADLARNYDQLVAGAAALAVALLAYVAGRVAGPQYFVPPPEYAPPAAESTIANPQAVSPSAPASETSPAPPP